MKKMIFGATMILAGTISSSILMAGSMAQDIKLAFSSYEILTDFGLMPMLMLFILVAVIGFIVCVREFVGKES